MAHLSLYDDDLSATYDEPKQHHQRPHPKPIPQRKPTGDFELFGSEYDDDALFLPTAAPLPPLAPWEQPYGGEQPSTDSTSAAPNDVAYSPSLLAVPDLVPDSPTSPAMPYIPNPVRRENAAAAPVGSSPPSSTSRSSSTSARAPPTTSISQSLTELLASHPEPTYLSPSSSFNAVDQTPGKGKPLSELTRQGSASPSRTLGHRPLQTAGWPQSSVGPGEYGDLERALSQMSASSGRMYNLLQHQLNSRAAPLSPQQSLQSQYTSQTPTLQAHHQAPHLFESPSTADYYRRTVSPQEAFLDYNDVDNALHSNPLFQSSFGVGVGVGSARGGSLFAPLPSGSGGKKTASSQLQATSRLSSPELPQERRRVAGSPGLAAAAVESQLTERASSVPPSHGSVTANQASTARFASRFAVPQNAVNWQDDDAEDEDDDDDEDDGGESDHAMVRSSTGGKKPIAALKCRPEASDELDLEETVKSEPDEADELEDSFFATANQQSSRSAKTLPVSRPASPHVTRSVNQASEASTPAAIETTSSTSKPKRASPLTVTRPHSKRSDEAELKKKTNKKQKQKAEEPAAADDSELTTPADDVSVDAEEDDSDEYVPTASGAPTTGGPKRKAKVAKRSRPTVEPVSDLSDDDELSDEDDDDDDDRPHHQRRRKGGGTHQPNKRRRRVPPAASASASASANAIRCTHLNADGTVCGVIFRRPYDLARHKETIHGEGGKVKKEWVCEECQGSFSRKDALLRHSRIRNHEAFA